MNIFGKVKRVYGTQNTYQICLEIKWSGRKVKHPKHLQFVKIQSVLQCFSWVREENSFQLKLESDVVRCKRPKKLYYTPDIRKNILLIIFYWLTVLDWLLRFIFWEQLKTPSKSKHCPVSHFRTLKGRLLSDSYISLLRPKSRVSKL